MSVVLAGEVKKLAMIKSKFKLRALLPFLVLVITGWVLYLLVAKVLIVTPVKISFIAFLGLGFLVFIMAWLLLGEIRTKLTVVTIEKNNIKACRWFGTGVSRTYLFDELDGFRVSFLPSEYNEFEYLYLLKENKKVIKLSSFYHRNYDELKRTIAVKTKNLGEEKFSLLKEVKEVFS
jgi:hypothetical protein